MEDVEVDTIRRQVVGHESAATRPLPLQVMNRVAEVDIKHSTPAVSERVDGPRHRGVFSSERAIALPIACALLLIGFGFLTPGEPTLSRTFLGGGSLILAWSAAVYVMARRQERVLSLGVAIRSQHWVQAAAQVVILLYWGWHVRLVFAFLPLIAAQLLFAYAVESLVRWSRNERYALGFGPWPVILSINLFLWFRLEWFHWQFAMILVGYLGKELIRWERDGRSAHIFNPSSLPLAIASLVLIATRSSDVTFGTEIASSQFYPPYIYVVIFLASLPGQLMFGVARMTLSAVATMSLISFVYLQWTGTYLFYDTFIPVAIFLGMHLLFTDPSTSPRTESGRILFGVMYALGTATVYVVLGGFGVPTFYDKLLPVPLMNLTVRAIDRWTRTWSAARESAPPAPSRRWLPGRRDIGYATAWTALFLLLLATGQMSDRPPGQALPFWQQACGDGSARACAYAATMTRIYCDNGSGWACNEWGILLVREGRPAGAPFRRGCELGFQAACANWRSGPDDAPRAPVRADPELADLPIVLRGTKPPLVELDPQDLRAIACDQGWPDSCGEDARGNS